MNKFNEIIEIIKRFAPSLEELLNSGKELELEFGYKVTISEFQDWQMTNYGFCGDYLLLEQKKEDEVICVRLEEVVEILEKTLEV